MLPWVAAVGLACSKGGGKGAGDDTSVGGDDSGHAAEIVYPDGDRILMYRGNGGHPGDGTGQGSFGLIDAVWLETFGWNTDSLDAWPEDLGAYRFIGLVAPGYSGEVPFSTADIALLKGALERGTRIGVFAEPAMCGGSEVNDLLVALGADVRLNGDGRDTFSVVTTSEIDTTTSITTGVSELTLRDPCYMDGGTPLVVDDLSLGNVLVAVDRPGHGGDIVLLGDMGFLDDTDHLDDSDNRTLALNLVEVAP